MADFIIGNGETQVGTAAADRFVITQSLTDMATLDGAGGIDTLEFLNDIEIGSNVTLRSIERLMLGEATLAIAAENLAELNAIVADDAATTGNLTLLSGDAAPISLSVTGLATLNVAGSSGNDLVELRGSSTDVVFFVDHGPRRGFGEGDDEITTGGGDDSLDGGTGTDRLTGGAGRDRLTGGIDFVPGAPDGGFVDTLNGGAGDDVLDVRVNDIADGGSNDDTFRIFQDLNLLSVLDGGDGDFDTLEPQNAINLATLGAARLTGIEELALDSEALSLTAGQLDQFTRIKADAFATDGALVLVGAGSASVEVTALETLAVAGSTGVDTLDLSTGFGVATAITVDAGRGDDGIETGGGADTLNGGDQDDTLDGREGADTLNGDDGRDTLRVRDGDDANGGDDPDRFEIVDALQSAATLDGGEGIDTLDAQGPGTLEAPVTLRGIEHLALDNSALTLTAEQLDRFTNIVADEGDDLGDGASGDLPATLILSSGGVLADTVVGDLTELHVRGSDENDDLIFRSFAADTFVTGRDGHDVLTTVGGGDDGLDGGIGDDTLNGGLGNDGLSGDEGSDTASYEGIIGGVTASLAVTLAQDTVNAGFDRLSGIENLTGSLFDDTLTGDDGDNVIDGGLLGADVIAGLGGSDTLLGGSGDDAITGSGGKDLIDGGNGDDTLDGGGAKDEVTYAGFAAAVTIDLETTGAQDTGGAGVDTLVAVENLSGTAFADTLSGNAEGNFLLGGGGDDTLLGRDGGDTLRGEGNVDRLEGGANADTILGGVGDDVIIGGTGNDVLRGNADADDFQLSAGDNFDTIEDFDDNLDTLSFFGFGVDLDTAGEIIDRAAQDGADVRITLPNPGDGNTTVLLLGFDLADLDAADFGTIVA